MDNKNLRKWLLENGGPAVYLNIQNLDNEKHTNDILQIDKVSKVFDYLDGFKTQLRDKWSLEHLIHYYKETAIENFFPILYNYGFKSGIVMDEKIKPLREISNYLINGDQPHHFYYSLMISQYFFMADYEFPEVIDSFKDRLDKLFNCAKDMNFDIYHDNIGLPKIPKAFTGKRIIKLDMNPFSRTSTKPLPTIYDLRAMAFFPKRILSDEMNEKINAVIKYIMHPEFQKFPEGYGLVYSEHVKRYHSCGWSPTLPYFMDYPRSNNYINYRLLFYLDTMSRFDIARKSQWFKDIIANLEQFKTNRDTYIFPKEYIIYRYSEEAFLSSSNMKLKITQRRELLRKIFSSLKMYEYTKTN